MFASAEDDTNSIRPTDFDKTRLFDMEIGSTIEFGRVKVTSVDASRGSSAILEISYSNLDLTYDNQEIQKKFTPSSTPYTFIIKNVNNEKIDLIEKSET